MTIHTCRIVQIDNSMTIKKLTKKKSIDWSSQTFWSVQCSMNNFLDQHLLHVIIFDKLDKYLCKSKEIAFHDDLEIAFQYKFCFSLINQWFN